MKKLVWTIVGLGLALTAPGCAANAAAPSLDGTSWVVTAINGTATIAGHQPTMAFAGGKLSGSGSCNRYSGSYTQNGSTLSISQLAMTQMACADNNVSTQEASFSTAVAAVTQVGGTADAVVLNDASGKTLLALAKAAATPQASASPLEGTTWQLTTIRTGSSSASVVDQSTVSVQVASGQLTGKACNTFRAAVTTDAASTFSVGPVMSTKMACPSDALSKQETTVLDILGKVKSMAIDGATLTLSTPDGEGLDFTAK